MPAPRPLPSPPPLARVAQAAKALAHTTRLRLAAMLRRGPLCVCQMNAVLRVAPSTVSGHLLELKRSGLVREVKRGKWVEYALQADGGFGALLDAALAPLDGDAQARADATAVVEVRAVALDDLCRADLDYRVARRRTGRARRARTR